MNKVLVVEDDFDTLRPLSELLKLKGYDVVTASEAEAALEVARLNRPDLIITDIALPGKSGLQFIMNVREDSTLKDVAVLVISGCGPMVLVEAARCGADCCLEKPIDIDSLWAAIDGILGSECNEAEKAATASEQSRRKQEEANLASAGEIDRLVDSLRRSSSRDERDDYLRRLKERILRLRSEGGT